MLAAAVVLAATVTGAADASAAGEGQTSGPAPLFEMINGRARIAEWDDTVHTTEAEVLRIVPTDFPGGRVYRNRLQITTGSVMSKPVRVPAGATHIVMWGRSNPEEGMFPRLRVSLRPVTDSQGLGDVILFEGYATSVAPQKATAPVPPALIGRDCAVIVTLLNPTDVFDSRMYRLAYLAFVAVRPAPSPGLD